MKTKLSLPVAAFFVIGAQLAEAHTELSGSVPADQAVLETAPQELLLHFSEPVRLTALSVQPQGLAKQSLGPLPADASEHFAVAAPALTEGRYTVTWRALSEDTHVMTGEFAFTVGGGSVPARPAPGTEPSEHSSGHSAH